MLGEDKEFLLDCARSEREDAQNETFRLTTKCSKLEEQLINEQQSNNDLRQVQMESMEEVARGQSELKDTQEMMQSSLVKIQTLEKNLKLLTKEREEWIRKEMVMSAAAEVLIEEVVDDGGNVEEVRGGKEESVSMSDLIREEEEEEARLLREKSNMTKEKKEKIIQEVVTLSEEEEEEVEEEEEEEEDNSSSSGEEEDGEDEEAVVPEYTLDQVLRNLESVGANNLR